MYILRCSDGTYYTGSTNNLELRMAQHAAGEGANHTKKRLPVKLVYFEEYDRIDEAFYREKQVQGWNRKKKEALINGKPELLPKLALAYRDIRTMASLTSPVASRASATGTSDAVEKTLPEALEGNDKVIDGELKRILERLGV